MTKGISYLLNRFAILFVLLFTIGVGQMWGKTVYIDISSFSSYDGDGNIVQVHYWGAGENTIDATCVVAGVMYKAEIPDGASWQVKERKGEWSGNEGNDCSSSQNFYYLTGWSKSGSAGSTVVKEYDGTEYIYWRTNPANYNAWGDDNATLQIRLIRLDGDNLGFVNATDKDATSDHVARYLVPAGTYLRPELHTTKNNAYTGTFEFSSTASDNFIYNFTNNGGWANWATTFFARSAYVYFDNTNSQWTDDYKEILVGRDGTSDTYNMTLVPNTNNLYCYTSGLTYNDFTQFCFIGNSSHWGQYDDNPNNRKGLANTNTANYQVNMDHSSRQYNLFIPAGTTKGTSLTHTAYGDYTSLNYTQTVEQKLSENGGDSYSTSTRALATVSVNSYKMTSATSTTADGGSITSGQSSKSCDAARTATVTYSVSSVAEGYTFVGWYDGNTQKSTSTTYTYEATEAKTITARFKANAYTVVFDGNDKTSGSMSNQTFYYNVAQNLTTNAYAKNGYSFGGWTTNNDGTGSSYTNGQSVSNWSSTDGASITIYAKWTPVTLTFTGATDSDWSTLSNWSPACVPTIDHDVVITKPVTVDIAYATAKSIVLDQNSHTGKLTIEANKGLEVAGTITRTTDGSNSLATREEDLILESSSSEGNASLIFNNSNACQATVQMYSKGYIDGNTWNWQYVGTPFTGSIPQYNYYGSWMYKWNNGWEVVHGGDVLTPFAGYCLTQESATTHVMGGTLVATDGNDQVIEMDEETGMVLANSWTAPIWIGGFTASTFTSTPATIYLFNTGSAEKGSSAGTEAGTYEAVPVNSGLYFGTEFIPSMQGFYVTTNGGSAGSITLKYDELVRSNEYRRAGNVAPITSGPMKAPKRAQENNRPAVLKMWANGSEYNDRVVILERADFSQGFDNGWDGKKMSFGNESPSVYVINEQGGYDAVSAIPTFEGTVVGFRAGTNNSCTMSFEYDGDETLYLNDLQAQQSTLISEQNSYTFTTSANDSEVRFIISATPIQKVPTGIENGGLMNGENGGMVRKLIINDHVYIIRSGRMYDATGVMVK